MLERWLGVAASESVEPEEAAAEALIDDARMRTFRDDYADIVDQLRRVAHKLKGSCQNIGATVMATPCRSIESGEGDLITTVEGLDAALSRTETALRRALA